MAIELKRAIHHDGIRYSERETKKMVSREQFSIWFDDQQRLDTQHAIHLALIKNDFTKANRRLNEAESSLVELQHPEGLELAIIEIHRAAIAMWKMVSSSEEDPENKIVSFRKNLLGKFFRNFSANINTPTFIREDLLKEPVDLSKDCGNLLVQIEDAWQALNRAEPILKRFRKSAWWATWYFELRIKLIEWQLFVSLGSAETTPLPFIGTQAAPWNSPTMLDMFLDNSRRIIRMDVFRLARVVESYSNSLLAIGLWRWKVLNTETHGNNEELKIQARELHYREKNMQQLLINDPSSHVSESGVVGARNILEQRFELRQAQSTEFSHTALSEDVEKYVQIVLRHSERVYGFSKANVDSLEHK